MSEQETERRYFTKARKKYETAKQQSLRRKQQKVVLEAQRRRARKRHAPAHAPHRLPVISASDFQELLAECNYACEVCGTDIQNTPQKRLVRDHNHDTGQFRGMACDSCNRGLGLFDDNPNLLISAAGYLKDRGHKHSYVW